LWSMGKRRFRKPRGFSGSGAQPMKSGPRTGGEIIWLAILRGITPNPGL